MNTIQSLLQWLRDDDEEQSAGFTLKKHTYYPTKALACHKAKQNGGRAKPLKLAYTGRMVWIIT